MSRLSTLAVTAIGVATSLRRDDVPGRLRVHCGGMIEVTSLTKRYGETVAVDDLSFTVRPGIVTGFLGPNGAGKSTTMRMILGLDNPSQGRATVNGRPLADHAAPLTELGALLEARAIHPQRSARNHLRALAATTGIPDRRVDEVLGIVGLDTVADRAAGAFSLGMGQRLGIASALLGDPETVMLDEPVNGLDPEGIRWIRTLLKELAAEGVQVTGDGDRPDVFYVTGIESDVIGRRLVEGGLELHELTPLQESLEGIFMGLTQDAVQYQSHDAHPSTPERRAA